MKTVSFGIPPQRCLTMLTCLLLIGSISGALQARRNKGVRSLYGEDENGSEQMNEAQVNMNGEIPRDYRDDENGHRRLEDSITEFTDNNYQTTCSQTMEYVERVRLSQEEKYEVTIECTEPGEILLKVECFLDRSTRTNPGPDMKVFNIGSPTADKVDQNTGRRIPGRIDPSKATCVIMNTKLKKSSTLTEQDGILRGRGFCGKPRYFPTRITRKKTDRMETVYNKKLNVVEVMCPIEEDGDDKVLAFGTCKYSNDRDLKIVYEESGPIVDQNTGVHLGWKCASTYPDKGYTKTHVEIEYGCRRPIDRKCEGDTSSASD